ncbi:MAG TPA: fibronectin type III domain-containing protein, partial [Chitinophagaceae bacterium]
MTRKATLLFILIFVTLFHAALSQVTGYSFTASPGTYTSITGGTLITLNGNGTDPVQDEGYANNIPLGFTFNYLGANYNSISASTNGFASFGTLVSAFFSNHLSSGVAARPLLAPLWEDLSLSADTGMKYLTTGAAGSRIFTLQWSNVLYDFGAGAAALSFQLRLHETINSIEFIYNQLPGAVQDFSGGASIGITGPASGSGSFLSLDNSSATPVASTTIATNTIVTRPATGQIYTFNPPVCVAPGNLNATAITGTGATISWTNGNATNFEYAVTTSAVPPASGAATSFTTAFAGGLIPGTRYYLHVRKDCSGVMSGWASHSFTTSCDAA